jgi:hypothetical protein
MRYDPPHGEEGEANARHAVEEPVQAETCGGSYYARRCGITIDEAAKIIREANAPKLSTVRKDKARCLTRSASCKAALSGLGATVARYLWGVLTRRIGLPSIRVFGMRVGADLGRESILTTQKSEPIFLAGAGRCRPRRSHPRLFDLEDL